MEGRRDCFASALSPLRGLLLFRFRPTAYAVGYILVPLRGYFRESMFYLLGCGWVATQTRASARARTPVPPLSCNSDEKVDRHRRAHKNHKPAHQLCRKLLGIVSAEVSAN